MGKEINQKELEKELDYWIVNLYKKDEIRLGKYYLEFWEKEGYDVSKYKEMLSIVRVLGDMTESYLYKKHNQN